ncbi:hypothetical protein I6F37_03865 [Bradyrhizobium sp. NBAIM08]|nr:hypothetical protein [Bradyrhizobium sp. NBAIM08]
MKENERPTTAAFNIVQLDAADLDKSPLWRIIALRLLRTLSSDERGARHESSCASNGGKRRVTLERDQTGGQELGKMRMREGHWQYLGGSARCLRQ